MLVLLNRSARPARVGRCEVGPSEGCPIKIGNEVIGAVGASGAPGGEKDEGIGEVEEAGQQGAHERGFHALMIRNRMSVCDSSFLRLWPPLRPALLGRR